MTAVVSHAASVTEVVRVHSHAASVKDVVSHAASVTNVVRVRKEEVIEMRPSLKSSEKHLRHHWVDTFEYLKYYKFWQIFFI